MVRTFLLFPLLLYRVLPGCLQLRKRIPSSCFGASPLYTTSCYSVFLLNSLSVFLPIKTQEYQQFELFFCLTFVPGFNNDLEIYPESETEFFVKDVQITFVKHENGSVTGMIFHQIGEPQHAKKIK